MKKLFFLLLCMTLVAPTVWAQDELDDFDFFEKKDEEEEDYFKKEKDSPEGKEKRKQKKMKSVLGGYAYYQIPGNITLSTGFHFVNTPRTIAIPHANDFEITVINNLCLGFRFTRFRYKTNAPVDSLIPTSTSWLSRDKWVEDNSFIGTATYHISDMLKLDPDKVDIYVKGYFGSNSVTGDWNAVGLDPNDLKVSVIGGALGARYIYNSQLSMYIDAGYSRFGIINFGLTYRIWDLQF